MCCNRRSNRRDKCVCVCVIDHLIRGPLFAAPLRPASCVVLEQREQLLRVQEFDSRLFRPPHNHKQAACEYCSGHITGFLLLLSVLDPLLEPQLAEEEKKKKNILK